jgi:drug/metabolite transporter (DMT)-like permease
VRISPLGPIATAFWRLSLALIPLAAFVRLDKSTRVARALPHKASEHITAALPGVFLGVDLALWHVALHMTTVANATLLANMAPIFVTFGSWLIFRQKISRTFLAGLAVSITGVFVLQGGRSAAGSGHLRGDIIAMTAAVFYGAYILLVGQARMKFPTAVIMMWSTFSAALCTLPITIIFERDILATTLVGWAILIGLAWITQAGGQSLIAFSLAWLPAAFSSLTLLVQPVVAAFIAWILLGETLTAFQIAGGAIVIAGIALARRG